MKKINFFLILLLSTIGCKVQQRIETNNINKIEDPMSWMYRYDFNNDDQIDSIKYEYTGGAHCCYTLNIYLSGINKTIPIPYYIEGGYMVFNLDKPENFNICDYDNDSVPEIILKVADQDRDNVSDEYLNKLILLDFNIIITKEKYYNVLIIDHN